MLCTVSQTAYQPAQVFSTHSVQYPSSLIFRNQTQSQFSKQAAYLLVAPLLTSGMPIDSCSILSYPLSHFIILLTALTDIHQERSQDYFFGIVPPAFYMNNINKAAFIFDHYQSVRVSLETKHHYCVGVHTSFSLRQPVALTMVYRNFQIPEDAR